MNRILRQAMQDSDNYVIELDYVDASGNRTRRTISPIRFVGRDRLLAMCLCREQPRQFYLERCENVRLVPAESVLMPMPISESGATGSSYAEPSALNSSEENSSMMAISMSGAPAMTGTLCAV